MRTGISGKKGKALVRGEMPKDTRVCERPTRGKRVYKTMSRASSLYTELYVWRSWPLWVLVLVQVQVALALPTQPYKPDATLQTQCSICSYHLNALALTQPSVCERRLDPSVLAISLSLHRHPFVCFLFSSRFTCYNKSMKL